MAEKKPEKKPQMKTIEEKSVGAVIFRRANVGGAQKMLYLVLHYHTHDNYWEFPRGGVEKGESETQTALREIWEETGLKETDLKFVEGFRAAMHYFYTLEGKHRSKDAVYFLAESKTDAIKLSAEHLEFKWLEYEDALKTLKFENARDVLKSAHDFLMKIETHRN